MTGPLPLKAIAESVRSGARTSVDVATEYLDRIERGAELGAFLAVDRARTLAEAAAVDARVARGEALPLAGVPVAVKDNIHAVGFTTTCASRMLEGFRPPFDATVVEKLRAAGAVVLGKTNLDEFAMGSSTENSAYLVCRNPWATDRIPGGSSGGSAAAVAANLAPAALGSDTGGSIRQPAALTGTVGLKPTYGRVSRFGLVAFGSSLDQVGPMTRRVEDAAILHDVLSGHDPKDATTSARPHAPTAPHVGDGVRGLRIGLPDEYFGDAVDSEIRASVESAGRALEAAGAVLKRVSLPHTPHAIPTYYIVATSEASSNLARYDGVHYGRRHPEAVDIASLFTGSRSAYLGKEVKRRILLGTWCLSSGFYDAFYDRALRIRSLLKADFDAAFRDVDLVLCPTTPTPAWRLGEKISDPVQMYVADILTGACNLAGIPGLAVPCGLTQRTDARLPIGAQLMGPAWSESLLLRAGAVIEAACWDPSFVPSSGSAS